MIIKLRKLILVIVMIGASLYCGAQSLRDRSNMMIGKVESSGTIRDRNNMTIGHVESDALLETRITC